MVTFVENFSNFLFYRILLNIHAVAFKLLLHSISYCIFIYILFEFFTNNNNNHFSFISFYAYVVVYVYVVLVILFVAVSIDSLQNFFFSRNYMKTKIELDFWSVVVITADISNCVIVASIYSMLFTCWFLLLLLSLTKIVCSLDFQQICIAIVRALQR